MAVDDIQLEFEKGSFNAILGPNGAGKSTIMKNYFGLEMLIVVRLFLMGEKMRAHMRLERLLNSCYLYELICI